MAVSILIVDDHELFRFGLRAALDREPAFQVVGEAEDGLKAVKAARELRPEVVVMDIFMPGMNGVEATRRILKENPHTKIVGLSMSVELKPVEQMLKEGASGFILKDCSFDEFTACIKAVARGNNYLCPGITGSILDKHLRFPEQQVKGVETVELTAREREVLQLLAEGNSNKEIADLLNVGVKTVETHRRQLMDKLGIRTVAGLTKYALREGLTTLDF